mmetsp:Transcript_85733/g.195439  ORF Transcript_85733/g.195439 Transcript_85733/m.195439 type:complete len:517 (-) Transcript_85733:1927-3477(-)
MCSSRYRSDAPPTWYSLSTVNIPSSDSDSPPKSRPMPSTARFHRSLSPGGAAASRASRNRRLHSAGDLGPDSNMRTATASRNSRPSSPISSSSASASGEAMMDPQVASARLRLSASPSGGTARPPSRAMPLCRRPLDFLWEGRPKWSPSRPRSPDCWLRALWRGADPRASLRPRLGLGEVGNWNSGGSSDCCIKAASGEGMTCLVPLRGTNVSTIPCNFSVCLVKYSFAASFPTDTAWWKARRASRCCGGCPGLSCPMDSSTSSPNAATDPCVMASTACRARTSCPTAPRHRSTAAPSGGGTSALSAGSRDEKASSNWAAWSLPISSSAWAPSGDCANWSQVACWVRRKLAIRATAAALPRRDAAAREEARLESTLWSLRSVAVRMRRRVAGCSSGSGRARGSGSGGGVTGSWGDSGGVGLTGGDSGSGDTWLDPRHLCSSNSSSCRAVNPAPASAPKSGSPSLLSTLSSSSTGSGSSTTSSTGSGSSTGNSMLGTAGSGCSTFSQRKVDNRSRVR